MKNFIFILWFMLLSIIVCSSSVFAFIYDIDEFEQNNNTMIFTDSFDDGIEPPTADLDTENTFGTDRESGGLLELNIADTNMYQDESEFMFTITAAVSNNNYNFSSGSGGSLTGVFEINNGYSNESWFGISISNYFLGEPASATGDEAWMGIWIGSTGNILAEWGDLDTDNIEDITAGMSSNTKATFNLSIDSSNNVTAEWDYGSDGSIDLTKTTEFSTLSFAEGDNYTGAFGAGTEISVVPEPISSTLFLIGGATLGFRRFKKRITN